MHGIHGETVNMVARDEHAGFVTSYPDKNKDHKSTAKGLRQHFGNQIDDVKSCKGFLIYSDSAPEYKKICTKLGIQHRQATPNSDEANGRHERFMGFFGDLVRVVLYQSGLPLYMWPYASKFAANMYNMIILPYLKSETPYKVRYPDRTVPTLAHFGSLCTFVPTKVEKFYF